MAWDYSRMIIELQEVQERQAERIKTLDEMQGRHTARLREMDDTLTVMAGIQARQAAVAKDYGTWLDMIEQERRLHRERMAKSDENMAKFDEKMIEMQEKLDALIHFVDENTRGKQ